MTSSPGECTVGRRTASRTRRRPRGAPPQCCESLTGRTDHRRRCRWFPPRIQAPCDRVFASGRTAAPGIIIGRCRARAHLGPAPAIGVIPAPRGTCGSRPPRTPGDPIRHVPPAPRTRSGRARNGARSGDQPADRRVAADRAPAAARAVRARQAGFVALLIGVAQHALEQLPLRAVNLSEHLALRHRLLHDRAPRHVPAWLQPPARRRVSKHGCAAMPDRRPRLALAAESALVFRSASVPARFGTCPRRIPCTTRR